MNQYYSENLQEELEAVDNVKKIVSADKLNSYFKITAEALEKVESSEIDTNNLKNVDDFLLMARSYYNDAKFFAFKKQDFVLAFGALNYAHAWLDAGARIGLFKVKDSRLFTVDD